MVIVIYKISLMESLVEIIAYKKTTKSSLRSMDIRRE